MSTRRRLAAGLLVAVALAVATAPARAQVVRAFAPRFTANTTGDVTLIGNTVMSCNNGGQCTNGRNGTGGNLDNNDFSMVYVDVDGIAGTFSSSTATLAVPAGASVLWAGLYWGGNSNNAARNQCRLTTPVAAATTLTATQLDVSGAVYQGYIDVTARVQAGGNGVYTVANVQSTNNTANVFAGWSLVVVYRDVTVPIRNLVVFDGYAQVAPGASVTMTVNGLSTPPAGPVQTRLGAVTYEGDLGLTGDGFSLNGTSLSDARNPATNFFNSSISRFGVSVTTKNPNYLNQLGFDADLVTANGVLPNNATSATIQLNSTNDRYYPGVVTFATDLYAPVIDGDSFRKTVTDVNGGLVRPGDVLEYTLSLTNSGQDDAIQTFARDTLPANTTYVPGSLSIVSGANAGAKTDAAGDDQMEYVAASRSVVARLGTGATAAAGGTLPVAAATSVRFRVTVTPPAPGGSAVSNQAASNYVGAQTGAVLAGRSDGDVVTAGTQPTVVTVTAPVLGGTVFEDANYGGGAGRTRAASAGTARPNARVELYGSAGAFLQADTTDASGAYAFDGWAAGAYTVRVVNATVTSARPGAVAGLLPVQTFRTDATSGTAIADANRVGGETPSLADAAANLTSSTLASLTTAAATPQSLAPVTLGTADIAGVDFGYSFDVIVNANDTGQGSLRQFVTNANALGNAGLAQTGFVAGVENAIFMVSDGAAHAGLRAGLANLLTAGVVRVTLASALPALADASTRIDGTTQTTNVGDTNAGVLGAGGSAGVDGIALGTLARPEVEIRDGAGLAIGLDVQGANVALANLAVLGFGNAAASDANADVRIGGAAAAALVTRCVLGTTASAFADPGAALRSGGDHVRAVGGDSGTVQDCLIGFGVGQGIALAGGSNGWLVAGCEIRGNTIGSPTRAAVAVEASGTLTLRGSLVTDHEGAGIDARTGTGSCTFENLSVRRSGRGTGAGVLTPGLRLGGAANRVDRCIVADNFGAGVLVASAAGTNVLTRNSMSGNGALANAGGGGPSGQIGIDLQRAADDPAAGTAPFVTPNDAGDVDAGANDLLNFPVLESAVLANGSFTLTGWSRPGVTIELFVAAADPSGFGEGQTYVGSFVEGSAADLDAAASAYGPITNGLTQGSDFTNRFRFTIAAPPGVSAGGRLTATATIAASGTSEFSGLVTVTGGVAVAGFAYADANHDLQRDVAEAGTGGALWVKLGDPGGMVAKQVVAANAATGAYALTFVGAGTYDLVLDDNADPNDFTPGRPAGWVGTEVANGLRASVVVNSTDLAGLNYGLWHGSRIDGAAFRDDGAAGAIANDGAPQAGEAGLAGLELVLASAACPGGACDSTLTSGAGAFTLWLPFGAAGGTARVVERNGSGTLSTGGRAGTTGGAYDRTADEVAFVAASGIEYSGLAFGDVPANTFAAPGALAVGPGGVAFYAHTFTAGSAGSAGFSAGESPSPVIPGWSVELYRDLDCDGVLDPGEPLLAAPVALVAGQTLCLLAKHAVPAGAPAGASELATLMASFAYTGATPALGASTSLGDLTTVLDSGSGLVITKSADRASARPGDLITYTIAYSNPGNAPLSAIVIRDATPPWTVFDSAGCAALGGGLTGCSLTQQPGAGSTGPVEWTLAGSLGPGASGAVTFRVRVQ